MIFVAGDLMLDVMLLSELRAEEQSRGILLRPGGSAANTAAWLARLGVEVTFAGCVGDDPIGSMLSAELRGHGVRSAVRAVAGYESGAVAVEIGDTGERVMRSARGANEALAPDDLASASPGPIHAIHLTGYALLGPPPSFSLLEAAGSLARQRGALLSFDPSSCGVINRVGGENLLQAARSCGVDLFLPNGDEALALTKAASAAEAAGVLAASFPLAAVKTGAGGAICVSGGQVEHAPAVIRRPVDTTGAGDAFNAGVLAGLLQRRSLVDACQLGHQVAAHVIMQYGGRPPQKGLL